MGRVQQAEWEREAYDDVGREPGEAVTLGAQQGSCSQPEGSSATLRTMKGPADADGELATEIWQDEGYWGRWQRNVGV